MPSSPFPYSAEELDHFRQVQRLAYDIALSVESQLQVGMTEIEVCRLMRAAHARNDIVQVFHEPYAWFGRRTLLGPDWAARNGGPLGATASGWMPSPAFMPTDAALAEGVPFVLSHGPSHAPDPVIPNADAALAESEAEWAAWSAKCTYHGAWRGQV